MTQQPTDPPPGAGLTDEHEIEAIRERSDRAAYADYRVAEGEYPRLAISWSRLLEIVASARDVPALLDVLDAQAREREALRTDLALAHGERQSAERERDDALSLAHSLGHTGQLIAKDREYVEEQRDAALAQVRALTEKNARYKQSLSNRLAIADGWLMRLIVALHVAEKHGPESQHCGDEFCSGVRALLAQDHPEAALAGGAQEAGE